MHPEVVSDQPGKCPLCGMALVPRETEEEGADRSGSPAHADAAIAPSAAIGLSPAVINQLGVRTAKVRRGSLKRGIEAFGSFFPEGWVPYQVPRPGAVEDPNRPSARRTTVLAQVPERHALFVQTGQTAWVRLPAPGTQVWKGTVQSVDPQVNQGTRTLQFRVSLDEALSVKPGMVARVTVEIDSVQDALLIPREAVIATSRSSRVVVALGAGRFAPREVVTEDVGEDEVIIQSGLNEGEEVVVAGHFLLDSEANLQAGLRRLTDERADDRQQAQTAHASNTTTERTGGAGK